MCSSLCKQCTLLDIPECLHGRQHVGNHGMYLLCICRCGWAAFRAVSLFGLQGALAWQSRGDAHSLGCCGRYCHLPTRLTSEKASMRRTDLSKIMIPQPN